MKNLTILLISFLTILLNQVEAQFCEVYEDPFAPVEEAISGRTTFDLNDRKKTEQQFQLHRNKKTSQWEPWSYSSLVSGRIYPYLLENTFGYDGKLLKTLALDDQMDTMFFRKIEYNDLGLEVSESVIRQKEITEYKISYTDDAQISEIERTSFKRKKGEKKVTSWVRIKLSYNDRGHLISQKAYEDPEETDRKMDPVFAPHIPCSNELGRLEYFSSREYNHDYRIEYDSIGRIDYIGVIDNFSGKSVANQRFSYNEKGNIVADTYFQGSREREDAFSYNSLQNLIDYTLTREYIEGINKIREKENYHITYNQMGKIHKVVRTNTVESGGIKTTTRFRYNLIYDDQGNYASIETLYLNNREKDSVNRRVILNFHFDKLNRHQSTTYQEYDKSMQLINEVVTRRVEYDEKGKPAKIEFISPSNPGSKEIIIWEYFEEEIRIRNSKAFQD
jgi:hypothetical protein